MHIIMLYYCIIFYALHLQIYKVSENVEPASDCNDDSNNTTSIVFIVLLVISFVINILFAVIIIYLVVKVKKSIYSPNNA